mmetsp:Transcript_7864/g.14569  ORF Transcript_7864/g.14569 Transcript_7864/m.14569 type:complete len:249 (-) Transcript_7864:755-1501(-)
MYTAASTLPAATSGSPLSNLNSTSPGVVVVGRQGTPMEGGLVCGYRDERYVWSTKGIITTYDSDEVSRCHGVMASWRCFACCWFDVTCMYMYSIGLRTCSYTHGVVLMWWCCGDVVVSGGGFVFIVFLGVVVFLFFLVIFFFFFFFFFLGGGVLLWFLFRVDGFVFFFLLFFFFIFYKYLRLCFRRVGACVRSFQCVLYFLRIFFGGFRCCVPPAICRGRLFFLFLLVLLLLLLLLTRNDVMLIFCSV